MANRQWGVTAERANARADSADYGHCHPPGTDALAKSR